MLSASVPKPDGFGTPKNSVKPACLERHYNAWAVTGLARRRDWQEEGSSQRDVWGHGFVTDSLSRRIRRADVGVFRNAADRRRPNFPDRRFRRLRDHRATLSFVRVADYMDQGPLGMPEVRYERRRPFIIHGRVATPQEARDIRNPMIQLFCFSCQA